MILQLRRRAACLLAIFVLALAACGEPSPESLLASAKEALAQHDGKAAVLTLKALLQQTPDSPEARFLLGSAFLDGGDGVSAIVELRKALDLQHPRESVVPALARAMVLEEQYEKVTAEFAGAELEDASASADLNTSLALAYARQGKGQEALAALDAALRAAPQDGRALALQARFKAEAGDIDGALALIDDIVRQDPANFEAWQLKGDLLYVVKRDAAAALDAHRQALKARGDLISAHASILSILLAQKDLAGAKAQLAALQKFAPNQPQTRLAQAEIAYMERNFAAAKEIALELLKFAPENAKVLQLAGAVEFQSGSMVQATALLSKALAIAPTAGTRRLLAQAHLRLGEPDKALAALTPLLQLRQPDAETLALAGQAHLLKGDGGKAEAHFARAVQANPEDTRSRTVLALGQFGKGNADLGFAQLEEIAAADKDTVADLALVSAAMRQGKFDTALKALDGYEAKKPNTAMAAHLRGMIELTRQDVAAARQHFERALAIDPVYFPAVLGLVAMDLSEKKPEQAQKRFEAVLAVDKNNVQALLGIVSLRASAGATPAELTGLLANAVQLNPAEVEPRLRLIDAQMRAGQAAAAMSTAQEGVAARPDSPELLDALARLQLAAGSTSQATASFNKLVEMQPRFPGPYLSLGELQLAAKDTAGARRTYQRALALLPDLLAAQRGLIMVEASAGRTKEALAMARAVQAVPARQAVGLLWVGDIEAAQKNWPAAVAAYRASLKLEDTVETATKLHSALLQARQPAEADRLAADWSRQHPKNPAMLVHLGNLAVARQDWAAAEDIYKTIVGLQPDNAAALNNLAVVTSRANKPGALGYAEKANALQPGQPAFMDTLAMLQAGAGNVDQALETEKQALALQPGNPMLRLNLARLYVQAGKKPEARQELDELAKLGSRFPAHEEVTRLLKEL